MGKELEAKLQELTEKYVGKVLKKAEMDLVERGNIVRVWTKTITGFKFKDCFGIVTATTDYGTLKPVEEIMLEVSTGWTRTDRQKLKRLAELQDQLEFEMHDTWAKLPEAHHVEHPADGCREIDVIETDWVLAENETLAVEAVKKMAVAVAKEKIAAAQKLMERYICILL